MKGATLFKKFIVFLSVLVLVFTAATVGMAQEEPDYELAYGSLVGKEGDKVSISEYNYETDEDEVFTYIIDDDTDFENLEGLDELEIGDDVEILYYVQGGKRIAAMISLGSLQEDLPLDDFSAVEEQFDFEQGGE